MVAAVRFYMQCYVPSDSDCQLNVFHHQSDPPCMNGTKVGVFQNTHNEIFSSLLQGEQRCRLESNVELEMLCDLSNEFLKGSFAEQKNGAFLIFSNFHYGSSAWPITMGLLHCKMSTVGRIAGSLRG